MLSINTNLSSLIAQNSMKTSTDKLNQAIERMTTGLKINHAKDNAANYSISTDLTTKISAYQIAEDNVATGLDLVMTTEETLSLIQDKLNRLRALEEQASNGTYRGQSLEAINTEAATLINEIYRIKNSAEYSGKSILGKTSGADMSAFRTNETGFIKNVESRNVKSMTNMKDVDENAVLAKGEYCISTPEELEKLARMQNSGKITDDSVFVLGANIDLTGIAWTSIGSTEANAFNGTFDGNGYKITNLTSTNASSAVAGLFGYSGNSTFKNLGIENVDLRGEAGGSLVAILTSGSKVVVDNCYAQNLNMELSLYSGGLIAGKTADLYNNSSQIVEFNNCYVKQISTRYANWGRIGGLLGTSDNCVINNCFVEGMDLNCTNSLSGGIVAISSFSGEITNCYSSGSINNLGTGYICVAGIAGGDVNIENCHFEGNLLSEGSVAGIHGGCYGITPVTIKGCTVKGSLKGTSNAAGISVSLDSGGVVENCHIEASIIAGNASTIMASITCGGAADILRVENCTFNKALTGPLKAVANDLGYVNNIIDKSIDISLQIGINGDENSRINFSTLLEIDELKTVSKNGLSSSGNLTIIDGLLLKLNNFQTDLGAISNRLESALDEISIKYENLVSSRSTIRDADMAKESAEYIQQQILQQASATLMATANQSPAIALQLI